jgi:spermidine synthase
VVAVSGLVYELVAGAAASYLLGDSVTQFSLVIGLFLTAMGVGAFLSRFVLQAERGFAASQIALGVIGGFSAPILFATYAWLEGLGGVLFTLVFLCGALSGLEIPLITRILTAMGAGRHVLANVLTADYLGALAAALAFPLLVVPQLGLMSASLVFGLLNLLVAGLSLWLFRDLLGWGFRAVWAVALLACAATLIQSERLVSVIDASLYEDEVIVSETTPYQQITVTRFRDRTRLFLNQSIQFDTLDEHRYHEMLVHPALAHVARPERVLVLGGGDGMAVREVLRDPRVRSIDLVDLDPRVTELFRDRDDLASLNAFALRDPRVTIHNADAWQFLSQPGPAYDLIIADLPDPATLSLSRLYTREFYAQMVERLAATGVFVTQAGSPLFAREAFWSIETTLAATRNPAAPAPGLWTQPLHVTIPSFGIWGFVLAAPLDRSPTPSPFPDGLRYLTPETYAAAQVFSPDMDRLEVEENTMLTHALARYYLEGWSAWFR